MLVVWRSLRWSLFTGRYSKSRHFKLWFPLSLIMQPRSIPKQPEMSRPSRALKFWKIALRASPVRRLRNLRLRFLIWGKAFPNLTMTWSSTYLQYERSSFWSTFSIESPVIKESFVRHCPLRIQMSYSDWEDFLQSLIRDESEMKLYRELIAWVLILKVVSRRPFRRVTYP